MLRDTDGSSGNWGLADQREAMRFVKHHIRSFGGDPERIMIAGQSAGAASVSAHLVATKSFGLYRRAGMMSGALPTWVTQSWREAQSSYISLVARSNCSDSIFQVECLRNIPADEMLDYDYVGVDGWGPTVDGVELLKEPWLLAIEGHLAPGVDAVIAGNTAEDGGGTVPRWGKKVDFDAWVSQDIFPNNASLAKQVEILYPTVPDLGRPQQGLSRYYWAQKHFLRDAEMACPARRTSFAFGAQGVPTYIYQFNHIAESTSIGEVNA